MGSPPRRLIVAADGGSRGNPGVAGYGAVVLDAATGEVLAEVRDGIGHATNNVAEYSGLIAGLRAAADVAPGAAVEVKMDSKLVVEQMSGRWKIKHPDLRSLAAAADEAAGRLSRVRYTWVPRAQNAHADRLANEAMDYSERGVAGVRREAGPPLADPVHPAAPGSVGHADPAPGPTAALAPGPSAAGAAWRTGGGVPTTTILLRHGQTPLSAEKRFAGSGDYPLTDAGLSQARAAAARLAERGGIDLIVTSPLRRAQQTAAEAAATTGAPVHVEAGIRETDFGAWEGLSFAEAHAAWPVELAAWQADPHTPPPGGESLADTGRRAEAALDALLAAQPGRTILVVSHVTPIKVLVARALLAPPAALYRMYLGVAALSEIDWYADGSAVLRSFNDTAHLRGL
ncbi:MAG TPA: bifunctional RNase H/acid phosphatase [Streptosporangiaceae bacterium]|jgi:probable phosphoglycerate mutase